MLTLQTEPVCQRPKHPLPRCPNSLLARGNRYATRGIGERTDRLGEAAG